MYSIDDQIIFKFKITDICVRHTCFLFKIAFQSNKWEKRLIFNQQPFGFYFRRVQHVHQSGACSNICWHNRRDIGCILYWTIQTKFRTVTRRLSKRRYTSVIGAGGIHKSHQ